MADNRRKQSTSFRLSKEAISLADRIKRKLGVSRTAVVELSLRRMAEQELQKKVKSTSS